MAPTKHLLFALIQLRILFKFVINACFESGSVVGDLYMVPHISPRVKVFDLRLTKRDSKIFSLIIENSPSTVKWMLFFI